jgi:hypothetical protein
MTALGTNFTCAQAYVSAAVRRLETVRTSYLQSALPQNTITARVAALNAKIDALNAVQLDDKAHPWAQDGALR